MTIVSRRFGTLCLFHLLWRLRRWNRHRVPKRRLTIVTRRRTTQKTTHNIQNPVKAGNLKLVYLLVFHECINEFHGSRSKIPSKKSRPYIYIYDVKFLTLLGAPYIYIYIYIYIYDVKFLALLGAPYI